MEATLSKEPWRKRPSDWPLELRVVDGEIKRGAVFHGTERQLKAHLAMLNSVGVNGRWSVDSRLLPEF